MKKNKFFGGLSCISKFIIILVFQINIQCLSIRQDKQDLIMKFNSDPIIPLNQLKREISEKLNYLQDKKSYSYLDNNKTNIEYNKFIESYRTITFYISTKTICHVEINDTVKHTTERSNSSLEHFVFLNDSDNKYDIIPRGIYSNDVIIKYFGFSQDTKTFSTYFTSDENKTKFDVEYIYEVKDLVKSFSDFRDDASFENILYNYNLIVWDFINQNENHQDQIITIQYIFDLGSEFPYEQTNFTLPMVRHLINEKNDNNKVTVKFVSKEKYVLKYNQTLKVNARFPLYFENCKNYKLNKLVAITGLIFIGFFLFVAVQFTFILFNSDKD